MINFLLLLIAIFGGTIFGLFAIVYTVFDVLADIAGKLALSLDMALNVLLERPMNDLLITKQGYQFGKRKETISSALGKNLVKGTLTTHGKFWQITLDRLEKDHCIKAIDNNV